MGNRWGPDGPPEEAYSRVTNPERFAPLHDAARALLDRLEAEFDVRRAVVTEPDDEYSKGGSDLPTVMLAPNDDASAPLLVTFTEFPGVIVRFGFRGFRAFPTCGCDACDESAEEEAQQLREEVDRMVSARYSEVVTIPALGKAHVVDTFEWPTGRSSQEGPMDRAEARKLIEEGRATKSWQPWSRRQGDA